MDLTRKMECHVSILGRNCSRCHQLEFFIARNCDTRNYFGHNVEYKKNGLGKTIFQKISYPKIHLAEVYNNFRPAGFLRTSNQKKYNSVLTKKKF